MISLLNDASRGTLEKIIDKYIEAIPPWIPDYKTNYPFHFLL